jgi:hypothetical protein
MNSSYIFLFIYLGKVVSREAKTTSFVAWGSNHHDAYISSNHVVNQEVKKGTRQKKKTERLKATSFFFWKKNARPPLQVQIMT